MYRVAIIEGADPTPGRDSGNPGPHPRLRAFGVYVDVKVADPGPPIECWCFDRVITLPSTPAVLPPVRSINTSFHRANTDS